MKAEIISIGTELTSGQSLDTNAQWLSRRLAEIGIVVGWHTTIGDDLDDNLAAFRIATARAGLVVATGGLGPTQDDLTREALAKLAGVDLVYDAASLRHLEEMFRRRNRVMPERNRVQALLPTGAETIPNDLGTAPGIWMPVKAPAGLGDAMVVAMPGVPSEMYAMFEAHVQPRVWRLVVPKLEPGNQARASGVLVHRNIHCFGAGESAVEERLFDLTRRGHVPDVGITVSDATITLRITARAATREEAERQIAPVEQTIRERLGDLVFGVADDQLQDVVVRLLGQKRLTLATAEGVTAGLVAGRLGAVPGASAWFRGGLVAYDNRIKVEMLGVPQALIDEHGAVSTAVAERMAIGCRTRFRTDLAVSTVGIAGPEAGGTPTAAGGAPPKPVGLVYVGLAWAAGSASQSFSWIGTRADIQSRTAKLALNRVRLHLLSEMV
jgi:nicotinamide-nucleotide amidase